MLTPFGLSAAGSFSGAMMIAGILVVIVVLAKYESRYIRRMTGLQIWLYHNQITLTLVGALIALLGLVGVFLDVFLP